MKIALCTVLLVTLSACSMLAVKEQQAQLDASCRIGGQVDAERRDAAPLTVVLVRQRGDSWQLADHFVLERPGLWGFAASPGTYGVVAFQDLNRDLKLQRDEPYLGVDPNRLITCKPGERRMDLALRIPADGRSRFNETLDISSLQARTFDEQMDVSLTQVTAVGEISNLSDPRFDPATAAAVAAAAAPSPAATALPERPALPESPRDPAASSIPGVPTWPPVPTEPRQAPVA